MKLQFYDITKDQFREATQADINQMQQTITILAKRLQEIKEIAEGKKQ